MLHNNFYILISIKANELLQNQKYSSVLQEHLDCSQVILNVLIIREKEKKEKKLEELKSQKSEFQEGLWNVNSVMLGGLGKEPVLEGG